MGESPPQLGWCEFGTWIDVRAMLPQVLPHHGGALAGGSVALKRLAGVRRAN